MLGVVNHVGQMGTLLMVEVELNRPIVSSSPTPCLEHLLSENILSRLFEWSQHTGRSVISVSRLWETMIIVFQVYPVRQTRANKIL